MNMNTVNANQVRTHHAEIRLNQRGITPDAVDFALDHGVRIRKQGCVFYYVRNKDIKNPRQERFRYLVVICDQLGDVITAYKNPDGMKQIKKKGKAFLDMRH